MFNVQRPTSNVDVDVHALVRPSRFLLKHPDAFNGRQMDERRVSLSIFSVAAAESPDTRGDQARNAHNNAAHCNLSVSYFFLCSHPCRTKTFVSNPFIFQFSILCWTWKSEARHNLACFGIAVSYIVQTVSTNATPCSQHCSIRPSWKPISLVSTLDMPNDAKNIWLSSTSSEP